MAAVKKRQSGATAADLAQIINDDCENNRLFWVCGLIKETLPVWQDPANRALLCEGALNILRHYESAEE